MKKYLKYIFILFVIASCSIGFSACSCSWLLGDESKYNVDVEFNKNTHEISFDENDNYSTYDIIVNDAVVETFSSGQGTYSFDLDSCVVEAKNDYTAYVKAYAKKDSIEDFVSPNYRFTTTNVSEYSVVDYPDGYVTVEDKLINNLDAISNVIHFDYANSHYAVEKYLIVVTSGSSSAYYIESTSDSIDLDLVQTLLPDNVDMIEDDRVYNIIVLVKFEGEENYTLSLDASTSYFLNTEDESNTYYTNANSIYHFAGQYHDRYIEDEEELEDLIYYAYTHRLNSVEVKVNPSYMSTRSKRDVENKIKNIINNRLPETTAFNWGYSGYANNTLKITFDYAGNVKECSISHSLDNPKQATIANINSPYYEISHIESEHITVDTHKDTFVTENVSTSEELVWAVMYGANVNLKNEKIKTLYDTIVSTLEEIITVDMTDYEKALSVFDYISATTVYDNEMTEILQSGINSVNSTKYNCFYLEGVFNDHVAVCDGYSKAYAVMMNLLDIPCVKIGGRAGSGTTYSGHAWNKVALDKDSDGIREWYIVDITWSNISGTVGSKKYDIMTHNYFLVTDTQAADHISQNFTNNSKKTPSTDYGYFDATKRITRASQFRDAIENVRQTGQGVEMLISVTCLQNGELNSEMKGVLDSFLDHPATVVVENNLYKGFSTLFIEPRRASDIFK